MIRSKQYLFVTSIYLIFLFFIAAPPFSYELVETRTVVYLKKWTPPFDGGTSSEPDRLYLHREGSVDEADGKTEQRICLNT